MYISKAIKKILSYFFQDIQVFIGTSFHAIAQIFGGYLIPFSLLREDRAEEYGYSVQSILCHYTSKTIDTSSQFARNRKGTGSVTKPSLYDIIQGIQHVRSAAWTADLVLNEESLKQGAPRINLLVHNLLRYVTPAKCRSPSTLF